MADTNITNPGGRVGSNVYQKDLGDAGSSYAKQSQTVLPDPTAGMEQMAAAKAGLMDAQYEASQQQLVSNIANSFQAAVSNVSDYLTNQRKTNVINNVTQQLDSLQQGLQIEQTTGWDHAALNDPAVKAAYDEATILRGSIEQGYTPAQAVALRGEAIIKKYSNASPAFTKEITQVVADKLGYDPSGSQIKALTGAGDFAKPKSPMQQGVEAAQQELGKQVGMLIQTGAASTPEEAMQIIRQKQQWDWQNQQADNLIKTNQVNVADVNNKNSVLVQQTTNKVAESTSNILGQGFAIIQQKGSISPQEQQGFRVQLAQDKQKAISNYIANVPPGTNPADIQKGISLISDQYDRVDKALAEGSLEKLTNMMWNTLPKAGAIKLMQKSPELAAVISAGTAGVNDAQFVLNNYNKASNIGQQQLNQISPGTGSVLNAKDLGDMSFDVSVKFTKGEIPEIKDDGDKFVVANTAASAIATPGISPVTRNTAEQALKKVGGTYGLLATYTDKKVENTVRSDSAAKDQFRQIQSDALAKVLPAAQQSLQQIKQLGGDYTIDPNGNITITKGTVPALTMAANSPAVKQLQLILKLNKQYSDVLGLPNGGINMNNSILQEIQKQSESPKSGAVNTSMIENANPQLATTMTAISKIESGGKYAARGPVVPSGRYAGERALGRYQIMPGNLASWSKEALGRSVTPEEFLANPELQDQVAGYQMNKHLNAGYTPGQVASIWHSGSPNPAGKRDLATGLSTKDYVRNVESNINNENV